MNLTELLLIDEKNYSYIMKTEIEPYLEKNRKDDFFFAEDNVKIHYEFYDKLLSRGTVVILHGFTESAEKFRETAYYFRKAGYSVFSLDLRDHGKSNHSSLKKERIETKDFSLYREDLNIFIEKIVKPEAKGRPIYIYSHSLGSAVALMYLEKYQGSVEKAVLSSPMICGNMGMPVPVASTVAKLICAVGGGKISAPGRCVFNPQQTFESSDATSFPRFSYYHEKRKNEPLYQTSGPSFSWVKASVEARDSILSEDNIRKIKADLLIFKPEEDKQLLGEYTDMFAEKSHTEVIEIENSKHEIFMSENEELAYYYGKIFEFFGE